MSQMNKPSIRILRHNRFLNGHMNQSFPCCQAHYANKTYIFYYFFCLLNPLQAHSANNIYETELNSLLRKELAKMKLAIYVKIQSHI